MKPLVFIYEQHQHELLRDKKNLAFKSFSKDNFTVFQIPFPSLNSKNCGEGVLTHFLYAETAGDAEIEIKKTLSENSQQQLFVFFNDEETHCFFWNEKLTECELKIIPEKSDLFSRSKGIIETAALEKKSVAIIGVGSGGSAVAVELAKAGVGNFALIDFDRLELSNIARHVCGLSDLGRYKTLAVRDAIREKNPYANVSPLEIDIVKEREKCADAIQKADLIIAASDNDRSRFLINEIALQKKIPAIFGRALTRAVGGDVLRVRPFEGPCYSCLYSQHVRTRGGDDEEISQQQQAGKLLPAYTDTNDLNAVIQVGLSADIAPISNFIVKLALVELSKGRESGISTLEEDLQADFYLWANRRENVYESWGKLGYNFNQPTILRWYGAKVSRDENCMVCGG